MARVGRPIVMGVEERREAIFVAAERLFGERGFESVTMAEIAADVGMSKKTLYAVFSSKTDLLQALISSSYAWTGVDFFKVARNSADELKMRLGEIGKHILSERHIRLCRLAISESSKNEELARSFLEIGIRQSRASLVDSIAKILPGHHVLDGVSGESVADMLVGATCFLPFMAALLNQGTPDPVAVREGINRLVDSLFVGGSRDAGAVLPHSGQITHAPAAPSASAQRAQNTRKK
jgi:TetR/AcrR family transcriptional regulator, mexJK operon transcriptional repressor